MGPATANAGVILGCIGSPSIMGVVVPLTLSEPFGIGAAVTSAGRLDAAAFVAVVGISNVLLVRSEEELGVASLADEVAEGVAEAATVSLLEVAASRGRIAYR